MYLKFLAAMLKQGKEETDNFNIFNSHIKYYHHNT